MTGDFTQGGGSFPFKFTRTGDPKVEQVKASRPLRKTSWEPGKARSKVQGYGWCKISNEASGAKAILI